MTAIDTPGVAALPGAEQVLAQAGAENFTVAAAILGRDRVRQLMAIYGFARLVDDVGDEAPGDRDALLDLVELELRRAFGMAGDPSERPQHPLMQDLARTVAECNLPIGPFERLVAANRLDQVLTRYATFEQLLGYCQLSAAPVGELVLGIFGVATPLRVTLSDSICAGLQIVEHLQDIGEDLEQGRVYMPREDMLSFGCDDEDLLKESSTARRALVAFEAGRARSLLDRGAPLSRMLPPLPRLAIAGFIAGGRCAVDAVEHGPRPFALVRALPRAVAGR
jgi:squalene synthase HpnC